MDAGDISERATPDDERTDSMVVEPGEKFDRYVILHQLGKGGMGVVFAAADPMLDRKIALKIVPPTTRESARRRLLREARAMAQLDHENVVKVLAVGEHQNHVFIAMELIDGETVYRWLNRRRRTQPEILGVLLQAGRGLQAAHDAGIVHRDFKPDNVMVAKSGRVYVLDFGLARAMQSLSTEAPTSGKIDPADPESAPESVPSSLADRLTRDGGIVGTPRYMAPEQMASLECTTKADQFSFCVTAYEALYRRSPFRGTKLTDLAAAIDAEELRPPPKELLGPKYVHSALARGLSASPSKRWPNLGQLLSALEGRSRRRVVRGVLVLGSATIAGGLLFASSTDRCDPIDRSVDEVLTPAHLAAIRAALEDTRSVYAEDAWRELERGLTTYASQWQATADQLCRAQIEQQRRERARSCLIGHLDALGDTVAGWRTTPADPFEFALVFERFSAPSACIDGEPPEGSAMAAPDPDPAAAARQLLQKGDHLGDGGDPRAAEAAFRRASVLARRSQDDEAYAEAQRRLGMMADQAGRAQEAVETLEAAFFVARDAQHDAAAGHIALDLAYVLLESLGRTEDARSWFGHAQGLLVNHQSEVLRAKLAMTSALIAVRDRKPFEALTDLDQAIRIWTRLDEPRQLSTAFSTLAIVHDQLGFTHAAYDASRQALELGEAYYGPDNPTIADLLLNAGVLRAAAGDIGGGLTQQRRALALLREADARGVRTLVAGLNVAQTRLELGQVAAARTELEELCPSLAEVLGATHPYVEVCERELDRAKQRSAAEDPAG